MGFRFRKSIRIAPGVRLNLGKRGGSVSLGGRGGTVNVSKDDVRTTIGVPGTGVSYSHLDRWRGPRPSQPPAPTGASSPPLHKAPSFSRATVQGIIITAVVLVALIVIFG